MALLRALEACIKLCDDADERVSMHSFGVVPGLSTAWTTYNAAWGNLAKADPERRYRESMSTYREFAENLSIKLGMTHAAQSK